jgi:hypothetical protein
VHLSSVSVQDAPTWADDAEGAKTTGSHSCFYNSGCAGREKVFNCGPARYRYRRNDFAKGFSQLSVRFSHRTQTFSRFALKDFRARCLRCSRFLQEGFILMRGADFSDSFIIAEVFKIKDGKIRQIEAVLMAVPYGMESGW